MKFKSVELYNFDYYIFSLCCCIIYLFLFLLIFLFEFFLFCLVFGFIIYFLKTNLKSFPTFQYIIFLVKVLKFVNCLKFYIGKFYNF